MDRHDSSVTDLSSDQPSPRNPEAESPEKPVLMAAAKGGLIGFIGALGGKALGLILQVLVSRLYGPNAYGLFFTGLLIGNMVQSISALGLHKASMRFLSIAHERSDHNMILDVFKTASFFPFMVGTAMAVALYSMAPFIAINCFNDADMVIVLRLISMSVPFVALLQVAGELSRGFKTTKYAVMIENLLFPLLQIMVFLAFCLAGHGLLSALYSYILASIVCSLVMLYAVKRQIEQFIQSLPVRQNSAQYLSFPNGWRPILAYSLPLTPFGLLLLAGNSMDVIMLNILVDSKGVGEYAAAARWIIFFGQISSSLGFIFGPLIAGKLGVNDIGQVRILYRAATRWMLYLTLPVLVFLLMAREPMMLVFGEQFLQDGPTVLGILLVGSLFTALSGSAGILLVVAERQYVELFCLAGFMLLNLLLNFILIPQYGVTGAALATIVSNGITSTARILLIYRHLKMHPFSLYLLIPLLTCAILCLSGLYIQSTFNIGRTVSLCIGISSGLIVLLAIITTGLDSHDRELFNMFRKKIVGRNVSSA